MFTDFTHLAKMLRNPLKNHDRSKPYLAALYLALLEFALLQAASHHVGSISDRGPEICYIFSLLPSQNM